MMYNGWIWGNGWLGWLLTCVVMVLFWGGVIVAIVFAVRYAGSSRGTLGGTPSHGPPRPEDVLAERFARGEIDEDEYRRRAATLREHR